jgi:NADPH:quinone reductase-like Zn-dependent oxidoreductase
VRQNLRTFIAMVRREDLLFLKELIEAGKVTPVIDRTYPLRDAAEAVRYLAQGRARGKVVITVRDSEGDG